MLGRRIDISYTSVEYRVQSIEYRVQSIEEFYILNSKLNASGVECLWFR